MNDNKKNDNEKEETNFNNIENADLNPKAKNEEEKPEEANVVTLPSQATCASDITGPEGGKNYEPMPCFSFFSFIVIHLQCPARVGFGQSRSEK